jgi:hypothetical protein
MYETTIITKSAALCLKCDDIIESQHRHDFVRCSCDAIFLDGGREYIRYGGNLSDIKLLTETRSKTVDEVKSDIIRYSNYTDDFHKSMVVDAQQFLESL